MQPIIVNEFNTIHVVLARWSVTR